MGDTFLKAPFDGLVARRYVDNFTEVRAKEPIVSFQDVSRVEVLVDVPEMTMATIREGGKGAATAEFAAAPGKRFDLSMKEFATDADARTQTYQVVLEMRQPKGIAILPGMTATVTGRAAAAGEEAPVIVPASAVFANETGGSQVWIIDRESLTATMRKVATGELTGSEEIRDRLEGVEPGETIAVTGVTQLRQGDQGSRPGGDGGLREVNIAELSIRKSVITWVMIVLLVAVGGSSFFKLSWLEDPEFTIKDAVVMTPYPGASAAEVEEEVTNVLEKAIQQLGQLKFVESRSSRGMSQVKVKIHDKFDKHSLPQVWDELRRKVNDAQTKLPPGAGPSVVNDDFGDVYGIYVALTGEGYSDAELHEFAKFLQRELLGAEDAKRIELYGVRKEVVYVEMRREKMAEFGVSPEDIYHSLATKNLPVSAGFMTLGTDYIPVNPTGEFVSEQEFGDLLVSSRGGDSESLVYLRDVAGIVRGYEETPNTILRFDGKPGIGLGISAVAGGNVVTMGESLEKRLDELKNQAPLGMELHVIAMQPEAVTTAINGFLVSLAQAVAIVVVVLLIFMGLRSGLIIGFVLLTTIMGTFIFMDMYNVTLERISLGALVIALGMLVDNAIVVTDGIRMKMEQGQDGISAAREVVGQTGVPLLGATFVAVAAFAAIGTSQDSTGSTAGPSSPSS